MIELKVNVPEVKEFIKGTFHLVFLSGHGDFQFELHSGREAQSFFIFEKENGDSDQREGKEIAACFSGSGVRCVVLSACRTGKSASHELSAGLANRIWLMGIPHVIGMRESILDRAGNLFAHAFFGSIARKERLDMAIQDARKSLARASFAPGAKREPGQSQETDSHFGQWGLPPLYPENHASGEGHRRIEKALPCPGRKF
jgi:CHAT domain-containing protein